MRKLIGTMAAAITMAACASTPDSGQLGEGMAGTPRFTGIDTARPPRGAMLELPEPAWVAIVLVAPGHSATLLYPGDSVTNNRMNAGASTVTFRVPEVLAPDDSAALVRRRTARARDDSLRQRARGRTPAMRPALGALSPETPTYLLLLTATQPLNYQRMIDKTAGVSIPLLSNEALNAVGKAIRSTLAEEPRTLSGYFQRVELWRAR